MNEESPIEATNEWLLPVKIIHPDICMTCGELDVENTQMEIWDGNFKTYVNRLKCRHYERCQLLFDRMKKEHA